MVDTSPCISFDFTNLSQVDGCLKYESMEACQDNEALQSTSMVMSYPHSFGLSSGINNFISMNILSPSTLYTNSIHGSHLVCYFPLNPSINSMIVMVYFMIELKHGWRDLTWIDSP
jgi:hypothetical protein